jgi:hypothetical protein
VRYTAIVALLFGNLLTIARGQVTTPKTLTFSGYEWVVRMPGKGGPGPNEWSPKAVWVDKEGQLHLKIQRVGTEWQCAEVSTREKFGYGLYSFEVVGWVDRLDPTVVLGLFDYPGEGDGPDGTNEIDIEFARWGNPRWPNGNYTVYPSYGDRDPNGSHTFRLRLKEGKTPPLTTHRFRREIDGVEWESFLGEAVPQAKRLVYWHYQAVSNRLVPQRRLPVHINLWLFRGKPPTDGKEVEIIIKRFAFMPEGAKG